MRIGSVKLFVAWTLGARRYWTKSVTLFISASIRRAAVGFVG
jgi:hypothetical protein